MDKRTTSVVAYLTWIGLISTVIAGYFSIPVSITILRSA